jgi:protein SCO1
MPLRHRLGLVVPLALLSVLSLTSAGCGGSSHAGSAGSVAPAGSPGPGPGGFYGAALPGHVVAPSFTLSDQTGRPVSLSQLRGQVVVIGFVDSTCGAGCVLLAQQIRGALDELPRPVPTLLISADPAADSRGSVRRFLAHVSLAGRVRYLSGPSSQVARVLRAYHVATSAHSRANGGFLAVLLVDRGGLERVLYGLEQLTPESLSHDIGKLEGG